MLLLTKRTNIDDDLRVSAPTLTSPGNERNQDEETSRRSKAAAGGATAFHLENLLHRQPAAFLETHARGLGVRTRTQRPLVADLVTDPDA